MLHVFLSTLLGAQAQAGVPPVPGGCSAPATENRGRPGCFLSAELSIADPPPSLTWHLFRFPDAAGARAEAARHPLSAVTFSHDRVWLHVLSAGPLSIVAAERVATAGPLRLPAGRPVRARFIESIFTPGMRTRNHAHPGPEAFYVLDGVQCMESTADRRMVRAGETYVIHAGPHVQSAPAGRRNIALLLVPEGAPWIELVPDWTPSDFCFG